MFGESAGVSSGQSVFRVHGEGYRFMGRCVRQTDSSLQTDVDSNPRGRRRPHEGAAAHAAMVDLNNFYVWSFDSIDEQLQSVCYRSLSRSLKLLADRQRGSEHRG